MFGSRCYISRAEVMMSIRNAKYTYRACGIDFGIIGRHTAADRHPNAYIVISTSRLTAFFGDSFSDTGGYCVTLKNSTFEHRAYHN